MIVVPPGGTIFVSRPGMRLDTPTSAWIPTRIANCSLWLRSDLGITTDVSDNVSAWEDQSGNSRDCAQTTESQRPAYAADQVNGQPSLQFDGGDEVLVLTSFAQSADNTAFVVMKWTGGTTQGSCLATTNATNPTHQAGGYGFDHPCTYYHPSNVRHAVSINNAWKIVRYAWEGGSPGTGYVHVNGDAGTSGAVTPNPGNWGVVGAQDTAATPTSPWSGDIAEIIIYDRYLSGTEMTTVETYLSTLYDITLSGA